jgi:CubicO group peptidase (beta-lactamase class C family)
VPGLIACVAVVALLLVPASGQAPPAGAAQREAVFPGAGWERIEKPESAGYSSARLEGLRAWLASLDTTAMFVSVGGRVLFEYGDVTHVSYLASVRKSVLAMLYGKYVENGTIPLDTA